jgi:hypothetical protein
MDDLKACLSEILGILKILVLSDVEIIIADYLVKNTKYSLFVLNTEDELLLLDILELQLLQGRSGRRL